MANWNEADHPRDDIGRFTDKGGGGSSTKESYEDKMQRRANILFPNTKEKETGNTKFNYNNVSLGNFNNENLSREDILFPTMRDTKNRTLIADNTNNSSNNTSSYNFTKPVDGRITSDFGYRKAPTAGASTGHSGIDIGVPVGTPIKSAADGTVVAARNGMRGYGTGVFIDHGIINGKRVVSEYGHLSDFDVKAGDKIKQGQVFAKSGNTGISTGPHLHVTIREDGKPVDPTKYFQF